MTNSDTAVQASPLLDAMLNLTRFHRDHEKFYASSPRERAVTLQRHARTLHALADRWSKATPSTGAALSPYAGADDLNDPAALQLEGVLFMEGEGEPAELSHLIRDLRTTAEDFLGTGCWLATAMQASWDVAGTLIDIPGLEDVLGDRHRIIANDWLAAHMSALVGRQLVRAADMLDTVDYTPAALRADLAGPRRAAALLHSAAEIINRAADLCSDSAGLVNDNERRWRTFRARVAQITGEDAADRTPRMSAARRQRR
jgi:hypothetical protein